MSRSSREGAAALRTALVVVLVLVGLVAAPTSAAAAVSVSRASLSSSGALSVEGRGAVARSTVTVTSPQSTPPQSTASGTADRDGRFRVSASGYRSSDCRARVSDGSTSVVVTLSGCTPSTTPPSSSVVITPDVAEIGPGYVGSDFVTFSATTTTLTLAPDALGPVRFEVVAGQLPAGLQLVDPDPASTPAKSVHASVTGTPTTVQASTFTVRATDANGLTASRTYTIRVGAARTLDLAPQGAAPALAVGTSANWWFDGLGGVRPYRWAISAGQVPPGMSLIQDNPDGPFVRVGGTPTTAGTSTFTLRLTDAQAATVSRTFTLTVPQPSTSTAPAAPTLLTPADGASVTTPFTIGWTQELDPSLSSDGGYNWQVSTTSTFSTTVARDSTSPGVTEATVGGIPAGTYFWRVQAVDGQQRSSDFSQPATLTVTGTTAPQPGAALSALAVSPSTVTGGSQSATGTVTLSAPAPTGGASVGLSAGASAASVPPSVTVPAGAVSATFAVGTSAVTTSTSVTLSGSYGGATRSATLTVAPSGGSTAGLTVTATGRSGERVTSDPAGLTVSVGSTGSASFATGTSITLGVSNARDAVWSGACSSGGAKARTCSFVLNGSASVTAAVQ